MVNTFLPALFFVFTSNQTEVFTIDDYPELLIANYDTTERARSVAQMTLFDEVGLTPQQILNERILIT